MIRAAELSKSFGSFRAVNSISFEIERGQIVGFIGPNGAGKTTTMRMLTGFIPATSGQADVCGFNVFDQPMAVRRAIGYLPETPPLYAELSIGEYLQFIAEVREVPRSDRLSRMGDVMERVGLNGMERRLLGSLSKGYRQRVGLAQAIIHDPSVLILDEPTSGLDPRQMLGIREFIRNLAEDRTVILSTHILSEVEALADRAIVIDEGCIRADASISELINGVGDGIRFRVELAGTDPVAIAKAIGDLSEVRMVEPVGDADEVYSFDVRAGKDPRTSIAGLATHQGWEIRAMERHAPNLEEAFLDLVGAEA